VEKEIESVQVLLSGMRAWEIIKRWRSKTIIRRLFQDSGVNRDQSDRLTYALLTEQRGNGLRVVLVTGSTGGGHSVVVI